MNRIDRLSGILTHLQSKSRVTISELEERFELSRRTIFRDIKALIETGIPIGGDAGEGYFIVEGYHLPPVVFNKQEAASLLLGAKFLESNADAKSNRNIESAITKVKAVLRYSDRDFMESLEQNISIIPAPSVQSNGFPDSHLPDIQFAIGSKRTVKFSYFSNYNQQLTEREVEPLGMVYYSSRWHLIAFCQLREDLRDFRTDRIQKLTVTERTFDIDRHPNYRDFINRTLIGTDVKEATLLFDKQMAQYLGEQKYYFGFVSQHETAHGIEMKFATPDYKYLGHWIMSYGKWVKVLEPIELQEITRAYALELYEHYLSSIPSVVD